MVYLLKKEDYYKVEKLFNGWPYPNWTDVMNLKVKIYVDNLSSPTSAVGFTGDIGYCAGKPNKALLTRKEKEWFGLYPQNKEWEKLIEECFPECEKFTRYAIYHDANFDREKLESYINALPEGYELKKIDSKIYDLIKKSDDEDVQDLIEWFDSKRQFLEMGIGYVVIKDKKVVGGASTAFRLPNYIDIEVDVHKKYRRMGIATAASSKLILDCLDQGIKPTWDAANMKSVHLSEKLGYKFKHKYRFYWISPIFFKIINNPDKSKWESYCGKYETNCKDFKLKEVWMKDNELYGLASNEDSYNFKFKFYPIGDNTFGRRDGTAKVTFGDGYYIVDGITCKKI